MYGGLDKDGGGIVGADLSAGIARGADVFQVAETAAAEEVLVCHDEEGQRVMMHARINQLRGGLEWQPITAEEAPKVVARSVAMNQMASMLHDQDRCLKYEEGIRVAIQAFIAQHNRAPVVLDIGTGTGLLAMFAVRHGAAHVYACEMWDTMADIAVKTCETAFPGKITVLAKKSTDIVVGESGDMPSKADLLVSEIFDSALLGEAVIPSFTHAFEYLLEPHAVAVPNAARVFVCLAESEEMNHMHKVEGMRDGLVCMFRNEMAEECEGGWSLVPVHWREFSQHNHGRSATGRVLSSAVKIFDFSFDRETLLSVPLEKQGAGEDFEEEYEAAMRSHYRKSAASIPVTADGRVDGLMLFWHISLGVREDHTEIVYSTYPGDENWQDHWVQCVFPYPRSFHVNCRQAVTVRARHNNTSIWFEPLREKDVTSDDAPKKRTRMPDDHGQGIYDDTVVAEVSTCPRGHHPEQCSCGWHLLASIDRMRMLNDSERYASWSACLRQLLLESGVAGSEAESETPKIVLDLSDGSMLTLIGAMAAKQLANKNVRFVSLEEKFFSRLLHDQLVGANELEDFAFIWDGEMWEDVHEFLRPQQEDDDDEDGEAKEEEAKEAADDGDDDEQQQQEEEGEQPQQTPLQIAALIAEPFYYQMQNLVIWQALNFWYQRSSLHAYLAENCVVLPRKATVMAALLELPELAPTHSLVRTVCGFDHSYLDSVQEQWYTHLYPYQINAYKHRLLSAPQTLCDFDYLTTVASIEPQAIQFAPSKAGTCHALAIWVDYELQPNALVRQFNPASEQFVSYQKVMVRFLRTPLDCFPNDGGQAALACTVQFDAETSEFKLALNDDL